jgi:putative protease
MKSRLHWNKLKYILPLLFFMHKLELNSPAGDPESLKAAVLNGADAVYLGVKLFSARKLASNFSMDELRAAVKYAHLNGVKIYVTMNTLLRNDELDMWFRTISELYIAGIDAVIIQEVWLSPLIKKFFPRLLVNASTQASLMNHHGINEFKDIDLAVLARELTSDEIKEIRDHTDKRLEIFVHGHLCISYSGQCLISSLIGKRSGNRGICASSCRKRYNEAGYLISPKDLMLADSIDRIYSLGIDSVKIEGRMKSPEYVAITTKTYRQQIDSAMHNQKITKLSEKQVSDLKMGFNREFTTGFFAGNKTIIGKDMPMNRGIYLGTVSGGFLKLGYDLKAGDGVGFFNPGKSADLEGFVLSKISLNRKDVLSARRGDIVSIPSRHFIDGTQVYITSKAGKPEPIGTKAKGLDISISEESGYLVFTSKGQITRSDIELQEAKQHALGQKDIEDELLKSRSIGIDFRIAGYEVTAGRFLPNSRLTKMRKELEEKILGSCIEKRVPGEIVLPEFATKRFDFSPRLLVQAYSLEQVREADAAGAYAIYYDVFSPDISKAKELCTRSKFFLDTPVILTDADIMKIKRMISEIRPDGITVGNWGLLDIGFSGEKHGKYSLNVFNDITIAALRERGIIPAVSVELNAKQVMKLKNKEVIFYSHGQIPVMHFKGEFKERALTDEMGYTFPLRRVNGNTEMLYSRPIAIFERIRELADSGIKYFLLDLTNDTAGIVGTYQSILNGEKPETSHIKQGTTIGNYNKGVA